VRRGDDLEARGQHLRTAQEFAHEGPAHVDRGGGDAARLPAGIAAIEHGWRQGVLVAVIDVAAQQPGQRDHLAHAGHGSQVPLRAGEGALRILPAGARDRQRVGLQFQLAAHARHIEPAAIVDRRDRDRHLPLGVADAQRLHRPAGQAEIAVVVDAFEIDRGAQPVVAAQVIAAQEGAVAGDAAVARNAPVVGKLEAAVAFEIATELLVLRARIARDRDHRAAREVARDLEGAAFGQLAVAGLHHRQRAGVEVAGYRQVLVVGDAPVPGQAQFGAVRRAQPEVRDQQPADGAEVRCVGKAGQRQQRHAEHVQHRALVAHRFCLSS
jgi:hypothetical protein